MPNITKYKTKLIEEINTLGFDKPFRKKRILDFIMKDDFNKAFLYACKYCEAHDTVMLELISLLLHYKTVFNIDLNYVHPDEHASPIMHVCRNQNFSLFFLLRDSGLDIHFKIDEPVFTSLIKQKSVDFKTPMAQFFSDITLSKARIACFYKRSFLEAYQALLDIFSDHTFLPKRMFEWDEHKNAAYDLNRIQFILSTINFISNYESIENRFNPLPTTMKPLDYDLLNYEQIERCRSLLDKICVTIKNFSFSFRQKHHKLFRPFPFSWFTFDQLAGIILEPKNPTAIVIPTTINLSFDWETRIELILNIEFFIQEYAHRQGIIEEAIKDIIRVDLPALKSFFEAVENQQHNPSLKPIQPVTLNAIKTITSYTYDMDNLIKLINYSFHMIGKIHNSVDPKAGSCYLLGGVDSSQQNAYQIQRHLHSKKGQHAALRLLQNIGELLTGKNFSAALCDIDPSIDWLAFIIIRNGIVHQDLGDNKYKIDQLLSDLDTLKNIVIHDLQTFFVNLSNILVLRAEKLAAFDCRPHVFWTKIFSIQPSLSTLAEETTTSAVQTERYISEKEQTTWVNTLKKFNVPEEILFTLESIFDGTTPLPNTQERGLLLRQLKSVLPASEYTSIKSVLMSKPKIPLEDRMQKRLQLQSEREQRERAKKMQFKGLEHIRQFADQLMTEVNPSHLLTPLSRVEAALDALSNIKTFLIEEGYLVPDKPYHHFADWDNYHKQQNQLTLIELLVSDDELNDAIEYNAAQLLQHLDTIRHYKEAAFSHYFTKANYEKLRLFRNFLEHGDPSLSRSDEGMQKTMIGQPHKGCKTAPMIIELIFMFLPELIQIKQNIIATMQLCTLSTSIPHASTPVAPPLKAFGFFSVQEKEADVRECPVSKDELVSRMSPSITDTEHGLYPFIRSSSAD